MATYHFALRLPSDAADWLKQQAAHNGSSINSELIRAVRERMARLEADG